MYNTRLLNYLLNQLNIQIKVTGLANSKHILINEDGIDLTNWQDELAAAPLATIDDFTNEIVKRNLRNSVFVDVSASAVVAAV